MMAANVQKWTFAVVWNIFSIQIEFSDRKQKQKFEIRLLKRFALRKLS